MEITFTAQPISTPETARLIGVSPRTLEGWRRKGIAGPPFTRIGPKTVRYDMGEVLMWLQAQRVAA